MSMDNRACNTQKGRKNYLLVLLQKLDPGSLTSKQIMERKRNEDINTRQYCFSLNNLSEELEEDVPLVFRIIVIPTN